MIHLTPADYTHQPWKNGRGLTTELWRHALDGKLLVRLSRAAVVEDGPFSLFPDVERNLTVLSGTGFRLTGPALDLRCDPMVPVAFPGDLQVVATETGSQRLLALYALGPCRVNERKLASEDLILTDEAVQLTTSYPVLAIRLHGVT